MEDLFNDPEVDAIYDSTPDGLHTNYTIQAAEAGKHILVEKPLGINAAQCQRSVEICAKLNVKLGVVFQERHQSIHVAARELVRSGKIGEVMLARVQLAWAGLERRPDQRAGTGWRADPLMRPGGAMMGSGDHCYDTLRYITGQEIREVSAFTDSTSPDVPDELTALVMMKLGGGGYGYIYAGRRAPFAQEDVVIHGTQGTIVCSNSFRTDAQGLLGKPSITVSTIDGKHIVEHPGSLTYRAEVEQFNRCISGDGEPMTSGNEGLINAAITDAIYESARSGRSTLISDFL